MNCRTYGCGCGPGYYGHGRRYLTKDEKLKKLKEYKEFLENEAKGVEERIKELKEE